MKEKSGIYRWVNKLNGKCYIGSSLSLSTRFSHYLYINYLKKRVTISNSNIYNALLTHVHDNFRLEVLEFCSIIDIITREQYNIDTF
jgi:group I intron endonuclease